ncbi:hypothetical protein Tco_0295799 [Tanacetum coccineum]
MERITPLDLLGKMKRQHALSHAPSLLPRASSIITDLQYVQSLEKEIDKLESDKANFSKIYDLLLQECVSKDVMCSYLHSLSDLDAHNELQCLYQHKIKECECLTGNLSKQTETREQYFEIQDLKAKLQDKNIAISELKKLIDKMKGKSVDTNFEKQSILGKPPLQPIRNQPVVNSRASAQKKDAQSHKTTKRYIPVEKKSDSKHNGRQIPIGQRFSLNKSSNVYLKTTPPRSGLTWKPTGRIFTQVGLMWIPIKKSVETYYNTNDSASPLGKKNHNPNTTICANSSSLSAGEVNPTHAYYNGSCTIKDAEDPNWGTSFKTRRTHKTSSALEALWKTLFVLYLYLIGTLYQDYQDIDCQGRLLASYQVDAKFEHVGQVTRSQDGKDYKDLKDKDLEISELKSKSKRKGSRSKITKHEGTSLQQ